MAAGATITATQVTPTIPPTRLQQLATEVEVVRRVQAVLVLVAIRPSSRPNLPLGRLTIPKIRRRTLIPLMAGMRM